MVISAFTLAIAVVSSHPTPEIDGAMQRFRSVPERVGGDNSAFGIWIKTSQIDALTACGIGLRRMF